MKLKILGNGHHYSFNIGDRKVFQGRIITKLFRSFNVLYDHDDTMVMRARRKFRFPFKIYYSIKIFPIEKQRELYLRGFLRHYFDLKSDNLNYKIIPHKGRCYTITKNDSQIGYFIRKKYTVSGQNNLVLVADDDIDLLLVASMVFLTGCSIGDNDSSFTIDIGNIGPEYSPFDKSWKPNRSQSNSW